MRLVRDVLLDRVRNVIINFAAIAEVLLDFFRLSNCILLFAFLVACVLFGFFNRVSVAVESLIFFS